MDANLMEMSRRLVLEKNRLGEASSSRGIKEGEDEKDI